MGVRAGGATSMVLRQVRVEKGDGWVRVCPDLDDRQLFWGRHVP